MVDNGPGDAPRVEALRKVLVALEACLSDLDRLGVGVTGPRLAQAIDALRDELGDACPSCDEARVSTPRAAED